MSSNAFTIHHLPYGVITTKDSTTPSLAIAYGEDAIDLGHLARRDFFKRLPNASALQQALQQTTWNAFATLDSATRQSFRSHLQKCLKPDSADSDDSSLLSDRRQRPPFIPLSEVNLHYPMDSHNYSDFYCSHEHAKNCSAVFNGQIAPNWFVIPQVYNGRTSSLAVSGTPVVRPAGIYPLAPGQPASFQAEQKFDFELEMGVFVSNPVPRGTRLLAANAKEHIFGIALLNDWSARSIQFFEIQPLGPFHSKGALTSVAAWITPIEALDEFAACARHEPQSPSPLPHLTYPHEDSATWNVRVSASVIRAGEEYVFSRSNLNELHWTPLQMITHLSSAGEGLSSGDIFGTGTLSSARKDENGEKIGLSCIWERQLQDARLRSLPDKVWEKFLEDGDEVVFRGHVEGKDGQILFGLGECRGKVLPAVEVEETER